jgi:type I restriction enzyme S subunit
MSGAVEARELLKRHKTEPLKTLTAERNGGIFNGPRFPRVYVDGPAHGVPFLGSTDILDADLSNVSFLSKKQVDGNPALVIDEGWTLITCSGTIGRMAYARPDMKGMAGSQHFMRVAPDERKITSGYLYAYLSSRFGVPIIVSGTYGAIIQHIEPHHIADLPVPRLNTVENQAHALVQEAAGKRVEASRLIKDAILDLSDQLGFEMAQHATLERPSISFQSSSLMLNRMDSFYFNSENIAARAAFDSACAIHGESELGNVADVWIPGIFKRQYVDDPSFGVPYFTGKEIYELSPTTDLYLKMDVAQRYRLLLERGMILIQDSGQISGLIGRAVMVSSRLHGASCTNNMVRVRSSSETDTGFVFALLSTEQGTRLLKREASGSSIPHLEENRIRKLIIPWPNEAIRTAIGRKILRAMSLRDDAASAEDEARSLVERTIEEGAR